MKKVAVLLSATSALSLMASAATVAQDSNTSDQEEFGLEEIIITARKRSESLQDTPIAVTAFSANAIKDAGFRETSDFIQLTSNVTLAESQSVSTSFLTIRGLTQVRNGEIPVAVLIDGVLQFNNRQFVQQLFDVEQIEVVKGPQGALYGRNAAGGAIIINTKTPTNETEGYVKVGYGKADEVTVEGSVSGAVIEDELFYRISGRIAERDGYFQNITLNDDLDPFSDRILRGRLLWTPSDDLSIDFKGSYNGTDSVGIGFQFGASSADDVSLPFIANNEDRGERETYGFSLKIEKDFDFATLTSVSSYDNITTLTRADQFPYTELANGIDAVPFGDGTQTQFTDIDGFSQELRLTSPGDQRFRWQVGAYYLSFDRFIASTTGIDNGRGIRPVRRQPFFDDPNNPTVSYFADDNENTAWALFFQFNYDLLDNLELTVAGRYDEEDRTQNVSPLNTGGAPGAVNEQTFRNFSPKVSLNYKVTDDISFYGTWGEGFRSGQFNQNGVSVAAANAGLVGVGDSVDRELSQSWEVGFKSTLFGNKLRLNGAYFNTDLENQQYFVFIGAVGAQVLVGIDEVELDGFEVEAVFRATEGLDVYASYGETNSEVVEYAVNPALVGNEAPYTPRSTFNAGAQWVFPIAGNVDFLARADYERRGTQFWSPDNLFPRSPLNLLNLRFALEDSDGEWTLAGQIQNVTNERYNGEFVLPAFNFQANPRVWRLDFTYNF